MKKIILGGLTSTIITLGLSAGTMAIGADVLTITADYAGPTSIEFSGTTDDGVLAVTCSLVDGAGKEAAINSVAVNEAEFIGEFEVSTDTEYTAVKCANYDGGAYVVAELENVIEPEEVSEEISEKTDSPETGKFTAEDKSSANSDNVGTIASIITISGIVIAGIVLTIIFKRRRA